MVGVQYDGLQRVSVVECPKPEMKENEVLVKIICAGICGTDLHAYAVEGESVGILPGNVFGHEMVGVIEETSAGTSGFSAGTSVFVNPITFRKPPEGWSLTMSADMAGAFSQYVKVENPKYGENLFAFSKDLPFEKAVLIEPLSVSMHGVNLSAVKAGSKALVYGAGTIGLGVIAALRSKGVADIIVSDVVDKRLRIAEKLGAVAFHPAHGSLMEFVRDKWGELPDNLGATSDNVDVVFDCAGVQGVFDEFLNHAKENSTFVSIANSTKADHYIPTNVLLRGVHIHGSSGYQSKDIQDVIGMLESGLPGIEDVVTGAFPVKEAVQAFEAAMNKDEHVKVILMMADEDREEK